MWLSNSSIGRKVVMSVTGIALVLFLTFHMLMNLVALFSAEGYNMVCEFLGTNWYALLGTLALAALFVIHDSRMGFSEHAGFGCSCYFRFAFALVQFLVQHDVC